MTFRWLRLDTVLAVHAAQLAEHGGLPGVCDPAALAAAIERPRQLLAYADPPPDRAALAAAYAFGLARSHPFADGNKRVALVALELFLSLNGSDFTAADADCVLTLRALAAGEIDEATLTAWVRLHSKPRRRRPRNSTIKAARSVGASNKRK